MVQSANNELANDGLSTLKYKIVQQVKNKCHNLQRFYFCSRQLPRPSVVDDIKLFRGTTLQSDISLNLKVLLKGYKSKLTIHFFTSP